MNPASVAGVNKWLKEQGIDATLRATRGNCSGRGYYYLTGPAVERAHSTSLMVYRLGDLSLDMVLTEVRAILSDSAANSPVEE